MNMVEVAFSEAESVVSFHCNFRTSGRGGGGGGGGGNFFLFLL